MSENPGAKGGKATLAKYGAGYFSALAKEAWKKRKALSDNNPKP